MSDDNSIDDRVDALDNASISLNRIGHYHLYVKKNRRYYEAIECVKHTKHKCVSIIMSDSTIVSY